MNSKKGSPILIGIVVVFFSATLVGLGGLGLQRDFAFEKSEGRSVATIDKIWLGQSRRHGSSHNVDYHYMIDGVTHHATKVSVMKATYYQLKVGQEVPIKYLPGQPEETRIDWKIETEAQRRNDMAALLVGCGIAGVGLLIAHLNRGPRAG